MNRFPRVLSLTCLSLLLAACGTSAPVRYFSLESDAATINEDHDGAAVVGLGRLRLAEYLLRPQIVTRKGNSELQVSEYTRWAEPLDQAVHRIVARNVDALLDHVRVVAFPFDPVRPEYRVHGLVERFDADKRGNAVLIVQWGLVSDARETMIAPHRASYEAQAGRASDTDAVVVALNATLQAFSEDIARQLQNVVN